MFQIILFLFLVVSSSFAQQEYCATTCLRPSDASGATTHPIPPNNNALRQGPPGKKGSKGDQGIQGVKGEKGELGRADQVQIERLMEKITSLEARLTNETSETEALRGQLNTLQTRMYCVDGVVYGSQCIYLPYKSRREDVQFKRASEICESRNCQLVELSSDEMYRVVEEYVRSTWNFASSSNNVYLWIGGRFEQASNPQHLITLSDGRRVRLTNWFPSYPRTGSSYTTWVHMGIVWSKDPHHRDNGNHNYLATYIRHVPLCACNM